MREFINKFYGVWNLHEWSVMKPDGNKTLPFSGNVKGYLMYHQEGWMTATLMEEGRADTSNDRIRLAKLRNLLLSESKMSFDDENLKDLKDYFLAANGYISYGGKFRVDEFNVYHEIETSLLPQWINTTLIRSHKFNESNDTLTLSAEQDGFVDQLIWKLKG